MSRVRHPVVIAIPVPRRQVWRCVVVAPTARRAGGADTALIHALPLAPHEVGQDFIARSS